MTDSQAVSQLLIMKQNKMNDLRWPVEKAFLLFKTFIIFNFLKYSANKTAIVAHMVGIDRYLRAFKCL